MMSTRSIACPGESYVGLTSALIERNSIRVVVCRHEGGAGYMAVADGRLRDRAGVAIVSRGPGLSNAMVVAAFGLSRRDADGDAGRPGRAQAISAGWRLQEQNYSRLLSDVTKLVIEVNEPEQASEAIARAFHLAESGTPGPVAVILPEDIFDEETEAELDPPRPRVVAGPRAEDLDRLAEMLAGAERPLVLVGGALHGRCGARQSGACRPQPARRGMGIADQPDASPAATVRRDAPEFRRLYGDPRAARADRRDEAAPI